MQADDKRTDIDLNKLREVIERCNVVLTERKSGEFSLRHILRVHVTNLSQVSSTQRTSNKTLDDCSRGIWPPRRYVSGVHCHHSMIESTHRYFYSRI
jgi:hypothetical protein